MRASEIRTALLITAATLATAAPRARCAPADAHDGTSIQSTGKFLPISSFGAVGDGKADDWGAIQKAVDAAIAAAPGARVAFESDCEFIDGDTRRFTHSWLRLRDIAQGGGGELVARFHGSPKHVARQLGRTKVGDFIAVKMLFPRGEDKRTPGGRFVMTSVANVNIAFSRGVRLEGLTSYAAPGRRFPLPLGRTPPYRACQDHGCRARSLPGGVGHTRS